MAILKYTCVLIAALVVSACGWQLRGWNDQGAISALYLVTNDRYAPLTIAILETMQQQGITHKNDAELQLHVGEESLRKRTVAVTSIGSPSQYELSLSVSYQYRTAAEEQARTLPRTLSVSRAFDFDPNNTVAKNEEENTLLEEMRRELALRILQLAPAPVDYGKVQL